MNKDVLYPDSESALLSPEWQEGWNFPSPSHNRRKGHCLGSVCGAVSPELANKLIYSFTKEGGLVLDMEAKGGSSLLEAMHLNRRSLGLDTDLRGIDLARLKTLKPNPSELDILHKSMDAFLHSCLTISHRPLLHTVFRQAVSTAAGIETPAVFYSFTLATQTILLMLSPNGWDDPVNGLSYECPFPLLKEKVQCVLETLRENVSSTHNTRPPLILQADENLLQRSPVLMTPENHTGVVDLVLTAPYFDQNKVGHDQHIPPLLSDSLNLAQQTLSGRIAADMRRDSTSEKPACMMQKVDRLNSFFANLKQYVDHAAAYLKQGGIAAWVVSEYDVSGIRFNTPEILSDFSVPVGMEHLYTFQGTGLTLDAQNKNNGDTEYVVIFRKK